MVSRVFRLALAAGGALAVSGATAAIAAGPPPPTATNGHKVTQVAAGLGTPTSFAFGDGKVFEGDGGNSQTVPNGGVFLLKGGKGVKLAGSPQYVAGLAWHKGALYVSGGSFTSPTTAKWQLLKWSGWNGTTFTRRKAIYTAPKKFFGFNGIAFGPDGRLYVGAGIGPSESNDHNPASAARYLYDVLSFLPSGKGLKVVAKGIRQPWQIAFVKGSGSPFVSALGQDSGAKNPPDFLLRVKPGQNYGFPKCNHTPATAKACKKFARPFKFLSPHTDAMGLAVIGKRLYVSEFGGTGSPKVVSMPLTGGKLKPLLTGFVAPIVGLGTNHGALYVGELTGQVFRVTP